MTVTETPPPAGSRSRKSAADMVRTMVVIIGFVSVIVLLVPRPNEVTQPAVNPAAVASGAGAALAFTPAVPAGLPEGWVARTAKTQVGTDDVPMWLLQYRTPGGSYAAVRQAADATRDWESRQVTDGREDGTVRIGSRDWVVRSRPDRGVTSWVLREGSVTTIVTGTASAEELTTFATALPAASLAEPSR